MATANVGPDEFWGMAGECFMFLLWTETAMRDLVVLKEGGDDMRRRYSEAFGKDPHPSDFSQKRMELGKASLNEVKERFLSHWPEWMKLKDVHDSIERFPIWRNALSHANVQPFRGYLLYTPADNSWGRIRRYMRCYKCSEYIRDCICQHVNLGEPLTLKIDEKIITMIYRDIQSIDVECFAPTAMKLNLAYQGIAWTDTKAHM